MASRINKCLRTYFSKNIFYWNAFIPLQCIFPFKKNSAIDLCYIIVNMQK